MCNVVVDVIIFEIRLKLMMNRRCRKMIRKIVSNAMHIESNISTEEFDIQTIKMQNRAYRSSGET